MKILIIFIVCFSSCTVLDMAPRPDMNSIKYFENKILFNKKLALKVNDERDKKNHSVALKNVFMEVFKNQLENYGSKLDEESLNLFEFTIKSYNIANSSLGCTVIISYEVEYNGRENNEIATLDQLPCYKSNLLSSKTINKVLGQINNWLVLSNKTIGN